LTAFDSSRCNMTCALDSLVIGKSPDRLRFAAKHVEHSPETSCTLIQRMIIGSGIDLAEIGRIQQSIDRYGERFLNRIYTPAEQAYCLSKRNSAESFAARFAAKEAAAKALGTGISHGVGWLEIEVVRKRGGRPEVQFYGRAAEIAQHLGVAHAALSITHTSSLAMASVLLEDKR